MKAGNEVMLQPVYDMDENGKPRDEALRSLCWQHTVVGVNPFWALVETPMKPAVF